MRWNMASAGLEIDLSCHVDKIHHNEIKYLLDRYGSRRWHDFVDGGMPLPEV